MSSFTFAWLLLRKISQSDQSNKSSKETLRDTFDVLDLSSQLQRKYAITGLNSDCVSYFKIKKNPD